MKKIIVICMLMLFATSASAYFYRTGVQNKIAVTQLTTLCYVKGSAADGDKVTTDYSVAGDGTLYVGPGGWAVYDVRESKTKGSCDPKKDAYVGTLTLRDSGKEKDRVAVEIKDPSGGTDKLKLTKRKDCEIVRDGNGKDTGKKECFDAISWEY